MEKSLKIARKKLFWVLLKAINSLFIITRKDFEKMLTIKSWFCQEFHFTYNNSHKLLRPTQFLKNFLEILKWSTLYQTSPPTAYLSTNTEVCAKKLPQLLAIKIDNGKRRIGLRIYVSCCRFIKKKFGFQVYNKVPN